MADSAPSKTSQLDVPAPAKTRPHRSPSQRFPSTALFQGFSSRNASRNDLSSPQQPDSPDPQRLPRPQAAPSLAGPSVRPSVIQPATADQRPLSQKTFSTFPQPSSQQDDFHTEAIWAEMQRTLADVELSALNTSSSSHPFGAAHSRALEDLRTAQLALAQSWARSEADEIGGNETDDSLDSGAESATVRKVDGLTSSPSKTKDKPATPGDSKSPKSRRRRASSTASNSAMAEDLEAETERDIQLARRRRAANDRYFQQVNNGVLDIVAKLDEVAKAMKQVERESRDVWDDTNLTSADAHDDAKETTSNTVDLDDKLGLEHVLTRTTTNGTGAASTIDSGSLTESPQTPKKRDRERKGK